MCPLCVPLFALLPCCCPLRLRAMVAQGRSKELQAEINRFKGATDLKSHLDKVRRFFHICVCLLSRPQPQHCRSGRRRQPGGLLTCKLLARALSMKPKSVCACALRAVFCCCSCTCCCT